MKYFFLSISIFLVASCNEKKEYKIKIQENGGIFISSPVVIDIGNLDSLEIMDFETKFDLVQDHSGNEMIVPYQIDPVSTKLWFDYRSGELTSYLFREKEANISHEGGVGLDEENGNMKLSYNNREVLTYRYKMTYPPEGVDSLFRKSGYIHPLTTPNGDTLTRIQPPDHYHHYGIWGPWTRTKIDTVSVDFWNLGDGQGTVRFKEFKSRAEGNIFGSIVAHQEHIALKENVKGVLALNEDLEIRLWNIGDNPNRYMVDYNSTFSTPLDTGILFEAYRYGGGVGIRATEKWNTANTSIETSEGKDRLTADGTNARWCIVRGESSYETKESGILFMSHPENRAHPEPMRVWPHDWYEGKSNMFFQFSPIRDEDWKIEKNKKYRLKYRMLVFDGELTTEEAENYWQAFAHPPEAQIIIN